MHHIDLFPCPFIALVVVRVQDPQLSDRTHYIVSILDFLLFDQLMGLRPQKEFVVFRVTRGQVLDVSVHRAQGLDHYTHIVGVVTDLGPGLKVLDGQRGQVEGEIQLTEFFVL